MKLSIYLLRAFSIFVLVIASPSAFTAPQVKTYKYGELQTYLSADFLYATQSFSDSGSSQSLAASGDYYYLLQTPFGARYSLSDEWAVTVGTQFAYAESKSSDPIYRATRNNSSVNIIRLGTDFLWIENPIELIPEFEFLYPLEKYGTDTDYVMTSEGVMEFTAALRAQQSFGQYVFFGKLGYTYRAEGRSHLLPTSIAGGYEFGRSVVGIELGGFFSITDDSDKNNQALRNAAVNRANAGVKRFFATNPSVVDLTLFWNSDLSKKWSLDFNGGYILAGNNYAQGPHVGAVITFNIDIMNSSPSHHRQYPGLSAPLDSDSKLSTDKDINMFKEEVQDGVDQKIFKVNPNPRTKPPQPPQIYLKKKRPVHLRPHDVGPTDQELQQQLDNTEIKIQLRKNK